MNIIFKKSQLALREEEDGSNSVSMAVTNDGGKDDTSSLPNKISKANQLNKNNLDITIPVAQFTDKTPPPSNEDMVTTIPNTSDAASKAANIINSTNSKNLPSSVKLQNSGLERSGKLIEVTTFKKKELDKFLKTL